LQLDQGGKNSAREKGSLAEREGTLPGGHDSHLEKRVTEGETKRSEKKKQNRYPQQSKPNKKIIE